MHPERIHRRGPDEVARIDAACRAVHEVLDELRAAVAPGLTTLEIDRMAEAGLRRRGAAPAFLGYRGFPASICVSVNEEVVHGIPSARRTLRAGDVVGLDLGAVLDGWYGDAAVTVPVGPAAPEALRLLEVTRAALGRGAAEARPGARVGDIGAAVQRCVEAAGFAVVRDFVGHGIGRALHEPPQVPNYGPAGRGPRLETGMVLAIEPMVNAGGPGVRFLEDGWTAATADGSLSAHFEHTVAVTAGGPRVLGVRGAPLPSRNGP
ncbi:MAG TPA: type I methionyl aminopeptidase [Anaeromyxobacteraceae bacterium]